MRGKATNLLVFGCAFGITPAYAGKSMYAMIALDRVQDHPRLCGEKLVIIDDLNRTAGSPPPMRGKVLVC